MPDELTSGQKAARTRKRRAAGEKAALTKKLRDVGGNGSSAPHVTFSGQRAKRGERMTKGKGWRLAVVKGDKRVFVGTLLETINLGDKRIAIFSVPK
jgi:hypothetical protein